MWPPGHTRNQVKVKPTEENTMFDSRNNAMSLCPFFSAQSHAVSLSLFSVSSGIPLSTSLCKNNFTSYKLNLINEYYTPKIATN